MGKVNTLGFLASLGSLFNRVVAAYVYHLVIVLDRYTKFTARKRCYPSDSSRGVMSRISVFLILLCRNLSEIGPSIIRSVSINVIDDRRPSACHVKPRQAMDKVLTAIYANLKVACSSVGASGRALGRLPEEGTPVYQPSKKSGIGIVVKHFAESFRGKLIVSHDALQMLIGQGPGTIRSRCPAPSLYLGFAPQ